MLNSKKTFAAVLLGALAAGALPTRAESVQVNDLKRAAPTNVQNAAGVQPRAKTAVAVKCENSPDGKNLSNSGTNRTPEKSPDENKQAPADNAISAEGRTEVVSEGDCNGSSVQQVELCDVTGTVCEDCGEIVLAGGVLPEFAEAGALAGGGFSLSPLFSLAAIPLALVPTLRRSGDDQPLTTPRLIVSIDGPQSDVTPAPPAPPTTPVPEPLSLLLFGSGLSAVAASVRRRQKSQLAKSSADAAVVEG